MRFQDLASIEEKKNYLEARVEEYNCKDFIVKDPISIPHHFTSKEDREIAGFLSATLAWGNRTQIIRNANALIKLMDDAPFLFLKDAREKEFSKFLSFVHRTFNGEDCLFILQALRNLYRDDSGMEEAFAMGYRKDGSVKEAILSFREKMFTTIHLKRSEKHISNPGSGSAAKRINMFLRWMVRKDEQGVDFGIWKTIAASSLMCPLDLHSGRVARRLGLLNRKQDDWKAVEELTAVLRQFDALDPVRYDFALFGMGIHEKTA
ncbi:MAG: TIGR02757 family protein [Bacteroidales bacterium]|nr:TIGR02757 family protein [Bacteroidales bacterium]